MLVKNVVKRKSKVVTSDVDVTVVLVLEVKIEKSSVKIFQKKLQVKIFYTVNFWSVHFGTSGMEIKVCKSREML